MQINEGGTAITFWVISLSNLYRIRPMIADTNLTRTKVAVSRSYLPLLTTIHGNSAPDATMTWRVFAKAPLTRGHQQRLYSPWITPASINKRLKRRASAPSLQA